MSVLENQPVEVEIAIIGAGFAGLGMGIRLKQKQIHDFLIFERADVVGGVWRDNTYPGCGCDVESHLYSFSFAPNAKWSRVFSRQAEIWQYLRDCTERFGLRPHLKLRHAFESAHWDTAANRWRIETSQGTYLARVMISAMGAFSEPSYPQIPGLGSFKGEIFHSAELNHSCDFKDRNVAVIGTGASSVQFIPELQPMAQKLTVFQRTPAWIMKRYDREWRPNELKKFARVPGLLKLSRARYYIIRELFGLTFRYPRFIGFGKAMAMHQMTKVIKDPVLREKLTPQYTIGCKRILLSNNFYPALAQPNVSVETSPIVEIRAHSIVTQSKEQAHGQSENQFSAQVEHPVDVIVLGTGFQVTDFPLAKRVFGKARVSLDEIWKGSPQAYLGTTAVGFPNFFFLLGPNTGLGHTSVVLMIEAQIEHTLKAIRFLQKHDWPLLEPREQKQREFINQVDEDSRKTVWLSGCKSWYLDRSGRNSSLWPRGVGAFWRRTSPFRRRDYKIEKTRMDLK